MVSRSSPTCCRDRRAPGVLNNVHAPLDRKLTWLAFLGPLVLLSIRLGGAPLFDVDEGAFSEATREMFERHDFLSTWLNGAPRFDKPILIYWCQAVFMWLFGPNEWAFRLPSALAAAAWCWAVGMFAGEQESLTSSMTRNASDLTGLLR